MLASLFNIPKDATALSQFSFANADEHTQINLGILQKYSIQMPVYVLDPIPADRGNWLETHQNVHNLMNAVLGIVGNDLSDVDFKKPNELSSWIWLHAQEHYQAAKILGTS